LTNEEREGREGRQKCNDECQPALRPLLPFGNHLSSQRKGAFNRAFSATMLIQQLLNSLARLQERAAR
jgi:hypothetical protein